MNQVTMQLVYAYDAGDLRLFAEIAKAAKSGEIQVSELVDPCLKAYADLMGSKYLDDIYSTSDPTFFPTCICIE